MWRELQSIIEAASTDSRVRAIVLASANEKVFTAGLDSKPCPAVEGMRNITGGTAHALIFDSLGQ